jgi:glycosyltransferase involved in cell wall biosynthesis
VACTPNTGSVVRDGVDGIIIAAFSVDAIVDAVERICESASLRVAYANGAASRAAEFTLAAYSQRLLHVLEGVLPTVSPTPVGAEAVPIGVSGGA